MVSSSLLGSIILLTCFVYVLEAHLCLNNPPQRGGVPIDALTTEGVTLCGNTLGPCGTRYPNVSTSQKSYTAGSQISVQIILNLQHRTPTNPGNISMSYCTNRVCQSETDFTSIAGATIPDPANVSIPASLSIPTTLPSTLASGITVLRAVYYTNEETIYYMCSDVTIQGSNSTNSTSFLNMKLGGVIEVLYVIIAGGGLVVVIVIVVVVVCIVKKRRSSNDDYYGSEVPTRRDESKPIPMMALNDIQSNLMKTAQDDDGGRDQGYNNGGYDNQGYGNQGPQRGGGYSNRY